MSELPEYVINREFDAPVALVWKAWTNPELLARWYGPGVDTVIHEFDLKPGGVWRNEMRMSKGSDFSRMDFTEVVSEEKIVYHHASVNESWEDAPNPMMPTWPQKFLTTITFTANGDKTVVRLSQVPMDASQEEIETFKQMMAGMDHGWGAGFDLIAEIMAELQA